MNKTSCLAITLSAALLCAPLSQAAAPQVISFQDALRIAPKLDPASPLSTLANAELR